jgi:hypothetical protein
MPFVDYIKYWKLKKKKTLSTTHVENMLTINYTAGTALKIIKQETKNNKTLKKINYYYVQSTWSWGHLY